MTDADIDVLVGRAAAFNKAHGITGILALEGSRVCQVLEGPAETIESLFASIKKDKRHSGVSQIGCAPIDEPFFEDWGMVRRPMVDIVTMAYAL